jgi:hypothetical protein
LLTHRAFRIASGYEDGNGANTLRHDPLFKLATGRAPLHAGKICATFRLSVSQLARTQQFRR